MAGWRRFTLSLVFVLALALTLLLTTSAHVFASALQHLSLQAPHNSLYHPYHLLRQ